MKFSLMLTIVTCFLLGCSATEDNKQMISGEVIWNGEPIPDGKISLIAEDGATDAGDISDGKFTLRTTPGNKKVSITAEKSAGFSRKADRVPEPEPVFFQYIPKQYNTNTELKEQIEVKTENLTLKLKGKENQPPQK